MYKRILVATDGSNLSKKAVKAAIERSGAPADASRRARHAGTPSRTSPSAPPRIATRTRRTLRRVDDRDDVAEADWVAILDDELERACHRRDHLTSHAKRLDDRHDRT